MSEITLLHGDNREVLKTLADKSVNTCVTSPPYFGLRDYGSAQWIDGAIPDCPHLNAGPSPLNPKVTVCWDCSAVKEDKQIGLEETPEEYVAALVKVFREIKRVLRDDGTLWLNLGDSYAAGGGNGTQSLDKLGERLGCGGGKKHSSRATGRSITPAGLKPKNLIGIPWRVAFALQADGWILRSDIIWSKPNAMPESVTDRPTKSHEYIFLFSKQPKYYYDNEAIAEPFNYPERIYNPNTDNHKTKELIKQGNRSTAGLHDGRATYGNAEIGRNKRSVWTVASQPYSGAHYAVFPEKLIEPCILAGTSDKGYCPICGAPWQRVIEKEKFDRTNDKPYGGSLGGNPTGKIPGSNTRGMPMANITELGWQQSCKCPPAPPIPGTVLDPFAGSGTTGRVAVKNRRNAILIELNPSYHEQINKRTDGVQVRLF